MDLRRTAVQTLLALILTSAAHAITWDFVSGAAGWVALDGEALSSPTGSILPTSARDGVWHVDLVPHDTNPWGDFDALSPVLGYPSELFNRVRLRLSAIHFT